jgi:HAE1 family hydrophobic/amphiphilic exporter-1
MGRNWYDFVLIALPLPEDTFVKDSPVHRFTAVSLKQRAVVVLLTILIALAGVFAVTRLKTELIPNIEVPILTAITVYPGAGPESVDQQISLPLTQVVSGLSGVQSTTSQSSEGFSIVIAEYEYGDDMGARQEELTNAIGSIPLPNGAQATDVQRINLQQFPIYQVSLTGGENADAETLRGVAQTEFLPSLTSADGVSRVEIIGGADNEVQILLDPAALAESGISMDAISTVLQANNVSMPVGSINEDGATLPVRVDSQLTSIEALESLVVGVNDTTPVMLGDIATIQVAPGDSSGVARTNGMPSIALDIYMSQGANTVETAGQVRDSLDEITERLATSDIDVEVTTILDQSIFIEDSIDSLVREASLGAIFAIIVILVFLLSIRSTLVTAISIPMSVLIAFLLLWWQGISLNIMTLGGLAVAIGRVVDDSIVVLESIYRHVQSGENTRQATLNGTKEVVLAITASTLTTVAVFLPLALVGGLIGEIFQPFALTVTFALLASLIVSLTIVPVMSSFFINRKTIRAARPEGTRLTRAYEPALKVALRRPFWTLAIATGLMVGSLLLTPFIGVSFLPSMGQPGASITVDYPEGTSEEETLANIAQVEEIVLANEDVEVTQTQIGGDTLTAAFTGAASNRATMTVTLSEDVDIDETLDSLRSDLSAVEGAEVNVASLESAGTGTSGINVLIQGDDYELVADVTRQLTEEVAKVEDVENVENDVVEAKPEIRVTVDSQQAALNGTAPAAIAGQVYSMLTGTSAGTVSIDGVPMPVSIRFDGEMTSESLQNLPVSAEGDATIGDVGTVEQVNGPASIVRQDTIRTATITGAITSNDTGGPIADVQAIIDNFEAPEGIDVSAGGIAQEQGDAFANMAIAIVVAIAAVYIIMVASFNSLTTPFVILFSLPLAIIGVLLALFISGKTLGLSALIGLLMLVGIVVTNAIVLLEYVIELRQRGMPLREAIIEGGKTRLRPILMTALATILALVPLALSNEGGALIAADLAVVVIGGLITSTLLTLFVIPVVYELIGGWQERRAAKHADSPPTVDGVAKQAEEPASMTAAR